MTSCQEKTSAKGRRRLISKYGDLLVNRQNMSRSLNMSALNTRNEIEAKLRQVELNAELAIDPSKKSDLFIEALKYHKQFANTIIENGLIGKLLAKHPLGNIRLLDKAIRSLIAAKTERKSSNRF